MLMEMYRDLKKSISSRAKSGNFGHQVNSDSDLVASYFNYWDEKNKLTKQTVKILRSRLISISTVCKRMSECT